MIAGIGLDLCEISRMEKNIRDERFLKRFFSEDEAQYIRSKGVSAAQTMAGIFAAKEAFGKALGTGLDFDLREAEILHDENGCPCYHLNGALKERTAGDRFLLTITHDGGMAAAVCILISGDVPGFTA